MDKEDLKYILNQVNDWLRYAEIKNGILSTFLVGGITFMLSNNLTYSISIAILFVVLCVAMLLNVISYIPKLQFLINSKGKSTDEHNILYFGHLKNFSQDKLEKAMNIEGEKKFEKDMVNQIIINSNITFTKFRVFNLCVLIIFIGIILALSQYVLSIIF